MNDHGEGHLALLGSFRLTDCPEVTAMWPSGGGRRRVLSSGKSKAGVTSNRRLCSTYCTIKANYWQTRSIARPLCDSRATCNQSSDIAVAQRIGVVEIVRTEMLDRTVSNSTSEWLTSCCAMLYISAAYAVMQCLSVCLSVCLSRSWILSKRIIVPSTFFHRRVAIPARIL